MVLVTIFKTQMFGFTFIKELKIFLTYSFFNGMNMLAVGIFELISIDRYALILDVNLNITMMYYPVLVD